MSKQQLILIAAGVAIGFLAASKLRETVPQVFEQAYTFGAGL
jgi:hypothetical protein